MEYLEPSVWMLVGLVLLTAGGELLVRGASALAVAARISPLIIGLTVVAFGTSSPELAVSVQAALAGQADLAVGNVVGSNIFNVLAILGLSALIAPLVVTSQLVKLDVPLMIAAAGLMYALSYDGRVSRLDGALLFGLLLAYITWSIIISRRNYQLVPDALGEEMADELPPPPKSILAQLALVVVGLALLTLGARWLVFGAVTVAQLFGMSELLIGLTIVAAGTSLPEAATSILASIRGERDIAVGNIVGSNLFNVLGVLGLTALLAPGGVAVSPEALTFDLPVMIAVSVATLPIFFTGHLIARWEGGLFLAYYLFYTTFLVLTATGAPLGRTFGSIILLFVLPLTLITLAIGVVRSMRGSKAEARDAPRA